MKTSTRLSSESIRSSKIFLRIGQKHCFIWRKDLHKRLRSIVFTTRSLRGLKDISTGHVKFFSLHDIPFTQSLFKKHESRLHKQCKLALPLRCKHFFFLLVNILVVGASAEQFLNASPITSVTKSALRHVSCFHLHFYWVYETGSSDIVLKGITMSLNIRTYCCVSWGHTWVNKLYAFPTLR